MQNVYEDLQTAEAAEETVPERVLFAGRITALFALSQHYLFLPFAALCMAAALFHQTLDIWIASLPLVLQIAATVAVGRLKAAFEARDRRDDPLVWAQRYTIFSGVVGAIWGVGAIIWFVPDSFPAQAYLSLAFLGLTATEFIARSAHRPAYLAHAALSLGPLAVMLLIEGGPYAMMSSVLVMFFGGVLYSYCGTIERMLNESIKLRYDNAELVSDLSRQKLEAEAARDAAMASERAKSAFFATISHELRTPLNAILGMSQLLERSELDDTQRNHVKVMLDAGRGLTTLLDDVIELARGQDDRAIAPDDGADAAQAARTVARLLQPNAWEKRLRLSIHVAADTPLAAVDPRQLRRVLLKLAGNAIKFTEKGGVEIVIAPYASEDGREFVRFRVEDTGPGIPPEILDGVFEPFARGDESYSRQHNGAGVGLAVSRRIVESFGGEIGVTSELGSGTTFWFTIPASQASTHMSDSPRDDAPPPSALSFLVFVANEDDRKQIEAWLSPFGNRLLLAGTLAEAVGAAGRESFDLVIAGADSADAIAATPGSRVPILALTPPDTRQPEGADVVLRWPARAGALYATIAQMAGGLDAKRTVSKSANPEAAAIDAKAIAELERSLGLKTLIDILQSYLESADGLAKALNQALTNEDWTQAGRVAQDFAGAAGGLGLAALTAAARALNQATRDGQPAGDLKSSAGNVLSQHIRVRDALQRLYPDLAA